VASWLLNQDILTIYQISQKYAANLKFPIDSLFKTSKSCFGCYNRLEVDRFTALKGALIECLIALSCFDKLKLQLQLENTWIYFGKVESEVVLLSARIELIGLGLNSNDLERTKALLLEKKKEIEDRACVYAGKTAINLNSPDEIAFVLFNKLKLKPPGTDERGVFIGGGTDKVKHHSTSKEVLLQLASQHDFPKLVILWRKINYALSNCIFPIERVLTYNTN
jgi:DNA polymerase-1